MNFSTVREQLDKTTVESAKRQALAVKKTKTSYNLAGKQVTKKLGSRERY